MFELLMLAGFLYAGLIHLAPQEKRACKEGEKAAAREIRPHSRLRPPRREARPGGVAKTRRLC